MGYFDMTIEDLDRAIDRVETIASSLGASDHKRESADLREAKAKIIEVRNDLLCRQHDTDSRQVVMAERSTV